MRALFAIALIMASAWFYFDYTSRNQRESFDDLQAAQEAALNSDWPQAARLLQRVLREENNPEKRWQAWLLNLEASTIMGEEQWLVSTLESMLLEYQDSPKQLPFIYKELGRAYAQNRQWNKATQSWMRLLDIQEMSKSEEADLYRDMGLMWFHARNFSLAEDMLEMCLSAQGDTLTRGQCSYYLAQVFAAQDKPEETLQYLEIALPLVDDPLEGQVLLLKGDVLAQQGKTKEAREAFNAALGSHPNPLVVEKRIESLKKTPPPAPKK